MYGRCDLSDMWRGDTPPGPSRGGYQVGGYPTWSIQRGVPCLVHPEGGTPMVHPDHGKVTCDPQCIMGLGHMGPPPPRVDRQTDRQTHVKTLPSHTTLRVVINHMYLVLFKASIMKYFLTSAQNGTTQKFAHPKLNFHLVREDRHFTFHMNPDQL